MKGFRLGSSAVLLALMSACGGHAPQLGELSSVEAEVRRGREFFVTALVSDDAQDLEGGAIMVDVEPLEEDADWLSAETPLLAAATDIRFEVLAGVTLGFTLAPGRIRVRVRVIDGAGHSSEEQSIGLNLIR